MRRTFQKTKCSNPYVTFRRIEFFLTTRRFPVVLTQKSVHYRSNK